MPSMKDAIARQALISEYLAAFKLANPQSPAPTLRYENGWFVLKNGTYEEKHRRVKVEAMRDTLLARAANTPSQS